MTSQRKLEKRMARLSAKHWEMLEQLDADCDVDTFDEEGAAEGAPLLIPDDEGRGLVRTLGRLKLAALVEEDGMQTGWVITEDGRRALVRRDAEAERRRYLSDLPRADGKAVAPGVGTVSLQSKVRE